MIQKTKILLFNIITFLYSYISFIFENILLKSKVQKNQLFFDGFKKIKINKKINLNENEHERYPVNKYFEKLILDEATIQNLINGIFIENKLALYISELTGFKYNLAFILAYNTYPIPKEDQKKIWHSNVWHRDRAFSKNTLKIIIPLKDITNKDGGIEIKYLNSNNKIYKMIADTNECLLFKPNLCFHRAGNLDENRYRSQIMMQINPSFKWSFNDNLFKLQKKREPKFPLLSSFKSKKIKLIL